MSDETARAGANPAQAAPQTAQSETLSPEAIRKSVATAVALLQENLMATLRMMPLCAEAAIEPGRLGLDAVSTAARLLKAQSDAAEMLARVARGESRHRTVVEYAGLPEPRLNSNFSDPLPPDGARKSRGKTNGKAHDGNGAA